MKSITDDQSLISDFQTLLTDPHPSPTIAVPPKTLSLPSQILSARSPYFRALLSDRWHPTATELALEKPNTSAEQFQDLLEFLTTGCISLSAAPSAIPHNIALAALAHETLASELEEVLTTHISSSLTRHTVADYLKALDAPLPPVDDALKKFLQQNTTLLPTLPHDPKTVKKVCRLLATASLQEEGYAPVARYIMNSRISVPELMENEAPMRPFLLSFPAPLFVRQFEQSGIFSSEELLLKYRNEAKDVAPLLPTATVRLLFESQHPHPRPALLEDTISHVVVPGGEGYAKLDFDKRSSLAGGAEIAFYLEDPALGTHPCKFLVGRRFENSFVLPANEFWFAFAATDADDSEGGVFERRWGWKLFVEACSVEIDRTK